VWGAKECVFTLFRSVESVCERKPVCAFLEQNVHVNFGEESLFAQEKVERACAWSPVLKS
jgi:hypothetical protein